MPDVVYFETSSINYLLDNLSDNGIIAFRDFLLHLSPDTKLCLSPISMWEISCTKKQDRKEDLVHVCQLLFDHIYVFPLQSVS